MDRLTFRLFIFSSSTNESEIDHFGFCFFHLSFFSILFLKIFSLIFLYMYLQMYILYIFIWVDRYNHMDNYDIFFYLLWLDHNSSSLLSPLPPKWTMLTFLWISFHYIYTHKYKVLFLFSTLCSLFLSLNNTLWNAPKPYATVLKQSF